jgi:hypothetical protein
VGATTPWAAQDWANTKVAYRFFANGRISEANILAGHFVSTRERCVGGYLARTHDPPPGNIVIWRGLSRLTDIELGIMIGVELVGN